MRKTLFTVLFCLFAALYGQQKSATPVAPAKQKSSVRQPAAQIEAPRRSVAFQFVDRETGIYTYDTAPVIFEQQGNGGLSLQPFITVRDYVSDAQLHMWVAYLLPFTPAGWVRTIKPKYLSIKTMRRAVLLPLIFSDFRPPINKPARPGTLSDGKENAYTLFSSDDIITLLAMIYEGRELPTELWEPYNVNQRLNELDKKQIPYENTPTRLQNISNFIAYKAIGKENLLYEGFNWGQSTPNLPAMADQKSMTVSLIGEEDTVSWTVSQAQFSPILEMIYLHSAFDRGLLTVP